MPSNIESCVLLHNFLLDEGDQWGEVADGQDGDGPHNDVPDVGVTERYRQAIQLRDQLVDCLWDEYRA